MKMPKKKSRLSFYAVAVIALLALAGHEGVTAETIGDWVTMAGELSGAVVGVLAMLNPKEDEAADQE